MVKKLCSMMSIILLSALWITNASASAAGVNVPFNVELKQKITTDLAEYHEFDEAVVQNQTIYVPERQGNKITAINASDRSIKWQYATNANSSYYSFSGLKGLLFFQANGTLTALKDNGTGAAVLWSKPYTAANFMLDGTTLYATAEGKVLALDTSTGEVKWEYALPARESSHSNIAIGNGRIFFVTDNQIDMIRKMYSLDASNGQVQWTTSNVDYYSQKLNYADGKLYVKSYDKMLAFDASNGASLWNFTVQANFDFEMDTTTIFTKTATGEVAAYDRTTKAQLWKNKAGSFSNGPVIVTPTHIAVNGDGAIKWMDSKTGQLVRTMTEPGVKIQPLSAEDGAFVAIDTNKNLYFYATASENTSPSPETDTNTDIVIHTVQSGETLWKIAQKYNVTIQSIIDTNKLDLSKYLYVGQKIIVPVQAPANQEQPATQPTTTYTVQSGDTLWKIAQKLGVTTQAIIDANKLDPTKYLYVGQKLNIPVSSAAIQPNTTYTVVSGDTLWKISQKFGVSIQAIVDTNKLDPSKPINIGQKLIMPSRS
ncbi:LysM peptidoglycan-binding domain-containing protein [Peribacillus sp. SCS-155]|uniref:LysM peptidoglycan-binding domain-containing protein n=1 Tax=Peribacillus sedimenti TaxID=3115297 RepID=UPI0039063C1B